MRLRSAVALALCATACGPAQGPARPVPLAGRVVRYQPLEMQRDARQPGQAVILGTDDANGSTVLAIPVAATAVVVSAMTEGSAGRPGELQPIVLTSAPRAPGGEPPVSPVQVGGADEGALAARWRAGVWAAALVAATALGKDLGDLALDATPGGPVEGTASALLAGGFAAALIGNALDPAAALTGAIEPDGAVGPVAGLPEQLATAIAHGKTRIGYPSGMRIARSAATGKDVDLVQLAREHRAEAIELADVHDAYLLLTGRRLPAAVPVPEAAMALDPATRDRLEARYAAWQQRLAAEWAPLLSLDQAGRMPAAVVAMVRAAHERGERAEAMHRAGQLAAAHGEIRAAWIEAAAANQTHALVGKISAGDAEGALAQLAALDPGDASLRAIFARIGRIGAPGEPGQPGQPGEARPATLAGYLAVLDALEAALRGWADHELAADALRGAAQLVGELRSKPAADLGAPAVVQSVADAVAPAVRDVLRAAAEVTVAEQALELADAPGVACTCPPASVLRAAAARRAVAGAALGHLDALLVEPLARKLGTPLEAARQRARALEPDYRIAELPRSAAGGLPHELAAAWGDGSLATGLLALAGARAAYLGAARVIAKYDAPGAHAEPTGAGSPPQALRALLATSERAARAAARAAEVATGAIPVEARLAYQRAVVEAAGGAGDPLDALADLWAATAASETAVLLARTCDPAVPR